MREIDVLALIGQGRTTKEFANSLAISAHTAGNHRKQICRKLNLHSTAELAAYAGRHHSPSSVVSLPATRSHPCSMRAL
ncbi:MAG: helix-turn-helix transcriptional regulator [Bryobacterales bacterium]|nr:helix-turn-helix transcriptional regulator [Bryobacterales bacterium]